MSGAAEVLYDLIHNPFVMGEDWRRRFPLPGQILERSKEVRQQMASLTSDDALKMRFEPWMVMDHRYEHGRRIERLLLDFDVTCRRR